jgi:hypothetical protein
LIPIACWKTAEAVSAKSRFSLFCCFFDLRFDLGMSNPAADQRSAKSSSSNCFDTGDARIIAAAFCKIFSSRYHILCASGYADGLRLRRAGQWSVK